jgi:hypothetical protein
MAVVQDLFWVVALCSSAVMLGEECERSRTGDNLIDVYGRHANTIVTIMHIAIVSSALIRQRISCYSKLGDGDGRAPCQ